MSLRLTRTMLAAGLGLAAVVGSTAAVAVAEDAAPTRLAIVAPIVVPATQTGIISAAALQEYTAVEPAGLLTRQLDAVLGRPVAIGVDPMIIASIRLLGDTAPPTASAWLNRLAGSANQVFPLAYADLDLTLATQSGSPVPVPAGFDFAIDPDRFAPATDQTPAPEADPAIPALPDSADLLAWPYSITGIAWPREGTLVAADLAALADEGYSTVLVGSGEVDREGRGNAAEAGGVRLAVADEQVSAALRTASAPGDGAIEMAALVASITAAGGGGTVLATLDRAIPASGSRLDQVLTALATAPGVSLVPLSQAIGEAPVDATVLDAPQASERLTRAAAVLEAMGAEQRFAAVAENPARIVDERRLRLLALLSNAWAHNDQGWNTATSAYLDDSVALRSSVQVVETSSLVLVADNAQYLPVTVSNELSQAASVRVSLRPTTSLLAVLEDSVPLTVPPRSQATVRVPVQSIANGMVSYAVTLTGPNGVEVGAPATGEVNVQAGWETPVVLVLAALVVIVFGVGIVRTILRRRRGGDD